MTSFKPDEKGVYRWSVTVNLYKKPFIFPMLFKIFSWIFAGLWVFLSILSSGRRGLLTALADMAPVFCGLWLFFLALLYLCCLFFAYASGNEYSFEYEMDDQKIRFRRTETPEQKALRLKRLPLLQAFFSKGGSRSKRTTIDTDFHAVQFKDVKKVRGFRLWHTISLKSFILSKDVIYTNPCTFETVYSHIISHTRQLS